MLRVTLTKFTSKCRKFMFHLSSKNNRSRTFCYHLPRILVFFTKYTEMANFLDIQTKNKFWINVTLQISSYKLEGHFQTIF